MPVVKASRPSERDMSEAIMLSRSRPMLTMSLEEGPLKAMLESSIAYIE